MQSPRLCADAEKLMILALVAAHKAMPPLGPPWKLVSPSGVLFVIASEAELKGFVYSEFGAENYNVNLYNMHCLLGTERGQSSNTETPKHVKYWQPLSRLQFIKHAGDQQPLPVVGGMGKHGMEHFVKVYPRPSFVNGKGEVARSLRNLLAGNYMSNKNFSNDWKGWSLVPPPENLEHWLPRGHVLCSTLPACRM